MTNVVSTCNTYRTYDEMQDNWETLHSIFNYFTSYNPHIYNYSMPGSFNDPDQVMAHNVCRLLDLHKLNLTGNIHNHVAYVTFSLSRIQETVKFFGSFRLFQIVVNKV